MADGKKIKHEKEKKEKEKIRKKKINISNHCRRSSAVFWKIFGNILTNRYIVSGFLLRDKLNKLLIRCEGIFSLYIFFSEMKRNKAKPFLNYYFLS